MSPLGFTDDEMDSLTTLASALPPATRDGFLQFVANKLSGYSPQVRGPGLVYRLAVEVQRDLLRGGLIAVGVRPGPCSRVPVPCYIGDFNH